MNDIIDIYIGGDQLFVNNNIPLNLGEINTRFPVMEKESILYLCLCGDADSKNHPFGGESTLCMVNKVILKSKSAPGQGGSTSKEEQNDGNMMEIAWVTAALVASHSGPVDGSTISAFFNKVCREVEIEFEDAERFSDYIDEVQ
jgi:hypothetical protein